MLGSVRKMNLGGNAVVLDGNKSCMQGKEIGQKVRIEHECGHYVMYLWVPSVRQIKDEEENKMLKGKKFAIPATEKEEMTKDFKRRA